MSYETARIVERIARRLLAIVAKQPHGSHARAVLFRIAGSPRGIVSADDVSAIVSAILNR